MPPLSHLPLRQRRLLPLRLLQRLHRLLKLPLLLLKLRRLKPLHRLLKLPLKLLHRLPKPLLRLLKPHRPKLPLPKHLPPKPLLPKLPLKHLLPKPLRLKLPLPKHLPPKPLPPLKLLLLKLRPKFSKQRLKKHRLTPLLSLRLKKKRRLPKLRLRLKPKKPQRLKANPRALPRAPSWTIRGNSWPFPQHSSLPCS